jgi:tRNA pseudouridine38-40 synthase
VYLRKQRPALLRNRAWHVGKPLDIEAMNRAAGALTGTHDFAAFAPASEAKRGSTTRCLTLGRWEARMGMANFDIEGNAFLRHMVRRMVAALVDVGLGKRPVDEFRALVTEGSPGAAASMAPARGLCLMRVRYESGLFDDETTEDI